MRNRLPIATLVVTLGSLAVAGGCDFVRRPSPISSRPPFASLLGASRTDQVVYARSLTYMATSPYADGQFLTTIRGADTTLGPWATNEPVRDAALYGESDYVVGRFASRIVADSAYPELGLEAGTNYVWIQQQPASGWFMLLVPDDTTRPLKRIAVTRTPPADPTPWYMPVARFKRGRLAGATLIWDPCPDNACCETTTIANGMVAVDTLP